MAEIGGIPVDRLRSFVERIERLEDEKAGLAADVKEVKAEAKSNGFDVKTINEMVKLRRMDQADRDEREHLRDLYKRSLGMLADTPLGRAAVEAAEAA